MTKPPDFAKLYKSYSGKIYRVCLGFVNDEERAKDLTQETFIAVWQNLDSFREEAAIGTWIYRIATNQCLRSIKDEAKKEKVVFPPQPSPPDTEEEKLVFLRSCIAKLAEMDRIIIGLFMEDLPQQEIAAITGLSHANVRVKVHRIKEKLLNEFKENGKF